MPRRQAENIEKKNQKERRVMSQKERVDLIEVDLLDMCKYILSKWVFILIGMVVFAGAGFGYAKVKSVTEYSSKMQVYVTVPKTSDKVLIRDNAGDLAYDYQKLIKTDLIVNEFAKSCSRSIFCALSCRFNKESKKKLGLIKQRNKEYGSKTFTDTKSDYIYR